MQSNQQSAAKLAHLAVALSAKDLAKLLDVKDREIVHLRRQVAWFQRQIFGQQTERCPSESESVQGTLGESFEIASADQRVPKKISTAAHEREHKNKNEIDSGDDSPLFFDDAKVPVEVIAIANPAAAGLDPAEYEVIGEKVSHRLAQRLASCLILNYVRPVIKLRATKIPSCPPAPVGVIHGRRSDVSFNAGMIIDKFAYHRPLYRQHVKLQDAGINVSRAWLTKLISAAVSLLEPIFDAQLNSVRQSRVIAIEETPIKVGRDGPGKMKAAYFWPVVGEQDEIFFLYYPSRAAKPIDDALGLTRPNGAVLQSDGYSAYAQYARKTDITHAQCWTHARRKIFDARDIEPAHADQALDAIASLYKIKQHIRNNGLTGQAKYAQRQEQAKPVMDRFFAWIDD